MLDEPRIAQSPVQTIAVLHLRVPRAEIQNVMAPGYREPTQAVAAQGVALTAPWFAHHLRLDPATFDFEIGVPVASAIGAAGRVRPSQRPALTVARAILRGGYEGRPSAWAEFDRWIAAQGHRPAPDILECYVTGPESSPDPADWRTQLDRPLLTS